MSKLTRKSIRRFIYFILSGIIIVYALYHLWRAFGPNIKTETAHTIKVFDNIDAQAYIIRNENIIENDLSGFLNFKLKNAEKIEKDGVIALVYSSEKEAITDKKIDFIKTELKRLEDLKIFGLEISFNPESVDSRAYLEINDFIKNVNNFEFNKLKKNRDNLLCLLNERQISAGKNLNLNEKINKLNDELCKLNLQKSKDIKKILAQNAGYFLGHTDGYENSFSYNDVLSINAEQIDSLIKNYSANYNNNSAKLVTDSKWFVVCNLKKNDAIKLNLDQYVELFMPLISANKIKAKVVSINQQDKNSVGAVVFECDYIDDNILCIRSEPIKISIAEYSGIYISKDAIHEKLLTRNIVDNETKKGKNEEKNVKGVYVRRGRQVVFREIDIIFSDKDYIICNSDENNANLFSGRTIKEYDEIVVKGRDLYDGKFI